MQTIQIGNRFIGNQHPCFIIAEAGVNHNGDVELAKELIRGAKAAGADCIKFQTFKAERVITEDAPKADYQLKTTDPNESQIEMLRSLELSFDAYSELIALCKELDIIFFSTPYNNEDVDFLDTLGVHAFKLASIHVAEPSLLQYVASKNKTMIISTGMATLAEIDVAIRAVRATGNEQFMLLQCTTNYPSRLEDANLRTIPTMCNTFDIPVGYSDHTQTDTACLVSIGLGACVIEKHFTLDKSLPGPDQSSSYDPTEFQRLVRGIREAEMVLGSPIKVPTDIEKINAVGMRRSIVAKRDIRQGEVLSAEMLTYKRPGTGLAPSFIEHLLNKRARHAIKANTLLRWADIEEEIGDGSESQVVRLTLCE